MQYWIGIPYLRKHITDRLDELEKQLHICNNIEDATKINGAVAELGLLLDFIKNRERQKMLSD